MTSYSREKLFVKLLYGKAIPEDIKESVHSISDDINCSTVEYWALSDVRNRDTMRKVERWIKSISCL